MFSNPPDIGRNCVRTVQWIALWTAGFLLSACEADLDPIPDDVREERARLTLANLYQGQERIIGPLTLYEAIARAVKYNLDARVKNFEADLAGGEAALARLNLLPDVKLSSGKKRRSNEAGSASQSLIDGSQSLAFSTSSEPISATRQLGVTWNMLDFGVSYVRAQQQGDRALIAEERRRAALHSIVADVQSAYWKLVTAQKITKDIGWLVDESRAALTRARRAHAASLVSPVESLEYQRKLLETIQTFGSLQRNLSTAKQELAALINLPSGETFEIKVPDLNERVVPRTRSKVDVLEQLALVRRPEIRQEDLEYRFQKREVQRSWLSMLPGIDLNAMLTYDDNKFLYNNSWVDIGATISKNLFELVQGPQRIENAERKTALIGERRKALTVAILTQVNIAYARYRLSAREFSIASELFQVNRNILQEFRNAELAKAENEQEVVRAAGDAIIADIRRDLTYVELQGSMNQLLRSVGFDLLPTGATQLNVSEIALAVRSGFVTLENSGIAAFGANLGLALHDRLELSAPNAKPRAGLRDIVQKYPVRR